MTLPPPLVPPLTSSPVRHSHSAQVSLTTARGSNIIELPKKDHTIPFLFREYFLVFFVNRFFRQWVFSTMPNDGNPIDGTIHDTNGLYLLQTIFRATM